MDKTCRNLSPSARGSVARRSRKAPFALRPALKCWTIPWFGDSWRKRFFFTRGFTNVVFGQLGSSMDVGDVKYCIYIYIHVIVGSSWVIREVNGSNIYIYIYIHIYTVASMLLIFPCVGLDCVSFASKTWGPKMESGASNLYGGANKVYMIFIQQSAGRSDSSVQQTNNFNQRRKGNLGGQNCSKSGHEYIHRPHIVKTCFACKRYTVKSHAWENQQHACYYGGTPMRHRKTACFGALVLGPHFAQSCGRFLLLTWGKVLAAAGSESFIGVCEYHIYVIIVYIPTYKWYIYIYVIYVCVYVYV